MKTRIDWEAMAANEAKWREAMKEWTQLTSHQKLARLPMKPEQPISDINDMISRLSIPFHAGATKLTWTLEQDKDGFWLKVHAQNHPGRL